MTLLWTVKRSHVVTDAVEREVDLALPGTTTFVHVEPAEERQSA